MRVRARRRRQWNVPCSFRSVTHAHRLTLALGLLVWPMPGAQAQPAAPAPSLSAVPSAQTQSEPAARKPPFPNRVNETLPRWLRLRGEFRERVEGFDGLGFDASRKDLYYLSRVRLNATVTPTPSFSLQAQIQDARVADKTVGPTGPPFRAPFDLRTAFADIGRTSGPFTVRVGRQELAYGDQRLVGHVSWLNAARTFDGVKATARGRSWQADAFATSVVRVLPSAFDRSGAGNLFAGAYVTAGSLVKQASVEPYLFIRRDRDLAAERGPRGTLQSATMGARWVGRLPAGFEYNTDSAVQVGSLGADDIRAWAGHYQLRGPALTRLAIRPGAEVNVASGDRNPADGRRGTFDQLYPTPHDKYGLADQVAWRNIRHLRAGADLMPAKGWPVTVNYHTWWLHERRDGLYAAGGALLARLAQGAPDRHVGQEVDLLVGRALSPQLQLSIGYAHIVPGAFLKAATPGASYSHPYVMATYVFLAER